MRIIHSILSVCCLFVACSAAEAPRLLRSLSGPSGKVVGSEFILDEIRSRFIFPADKSLTVYFQWEAPPGDHVLTAIWKRPDGGVASISPDVKIETKTPALNSYWVFTLYSGMANGVWAMEVRIDGQPAGSHPFEVAGMPAETSAVSVPKALTLDDVFKTLGPSLVWIHKLDNAGKRFDTATGFVLQPNVIATAFQAIDSAGNLEIEFSTGSKIQTDKVLACSRNADWALLRVDSGSVSPIPSGDSERVAVGEHLAAFNVDAGVRVLGTVDIGGQSTLAGFGRRIQLSPPVAPEAAGGPLIDASGSVVGILGGSLNPGSRIGHDAPSVNPGLWKLFALENAATAISEIRNPVPVATKTLAELAAAGTLTAPLVPRPEFIYGGTTALLFKNSSALPPTDTSEFSRHDAEVHVYSMWARKGKVGKGELSIAMYDAANQSVLTVPAKKISLVESAQRFAVSFSASSLKPGIYRIDLQWNGKPAWRTFIRVSD